MNIWTALLLSGVFGGPSVAAKERAADPAWYRCRADADCALGFDPCGWPAAVNGKRRKVHEDWAREVGAAIDCLAPRKEDVRDPVCVRRRCEALRKVGKEEARARRECLEKGGEWGGLEHGRGRTPGCALPAPDAGKPCTDGAQCASRFCLARKGESAEQTRCHAFLSVPKGCFTFREKERAESRCID